MKKSVGFKVLKEHVIDMDLFHVTGELFQRARSSGKFQTRSTKRKGFSDVEFDYQTERKKASGK
ncbi:MAG: hypothetical protein VX294_02675 [Candidatus Latescibacterota bacterium]|nr:hypothetical protein [Candidatus Latescibacterota bacterium]